MNGHRVYPRLAGYSKVCLFSQTDEIDTEETRRVFWIIRIKRGFSHTSVKGTKKAGFIVLTVTETCTLVLRAMMVVGLKIEEEEEDVQEWRGCGSAPTRVVPAGYTNK